MQEMCDKCNKVLNPMGMKIPERSDPVKVIPENNSIPEIILHGRWSNREAEFED
jgi:hypothetical protein